MSRPTRLARASARFLLLGSSLALVASLATAGPVSTSHVFERVGRSATNVAAMLSMGDRGRALMLQHDGDLRVTTGDGLVNDLLYHVTVSSTFAGDGLLDGTWDLAAPGSVLFITYIQPTPRKLVVARIEIENGAVLTFEILYSVTIPPAANQNLGGGIAMGADRKLYVGIGDMGNPNGAQQPTTLQGKIFRLNSDSGGGIPADNPVSATSPVYATGVRNPVRLATDENTGITYFVDAGPAANDELNIVSRYVNYGWSRFTGPVLTSGFQDPIYTWATAIVPTGLAVNAGSNFGPSAIGDLFVSGSAGIISRLHPNPTLPPPSTATETVLYRSTASEPADLADLDIRADGFVYTPRVGGIVHRLKSNAGGIGEPSDRGSITPITLRKTTGNQIEFSVEREASIEQFGLYSGDLAQSWSSFPASTWYTHPAISTDLRNVDAIVGEAYSKFSADGSTFPALTYFTFSGLNDRAETVTGYDSNRALRPGGNQTFGCPCPTGTVEGPNPGQCGPDWTLPEGVEGQSSPGVWNVYGPTGMPPMNFGEMFDCKVVLLDLSMEWCGPCRAMAGHAESMYQDYKDQGFVFLYAIPEDINGNPADMAAIQRWATDFGLTCPVMRDNTYLVYSKYNTTNAIPQTILIGRDGVVTDHWTGDPGEAAQRAAIQRELAR